MVVMFYIRKMRKKGEATARGLPFALLVDSAQFLERIHQLDLQHAAAINGRWKVAEIGRRQIQIGNSEVRVIEPIVGLSTKRQRLSLEVPHRHFESTLDGKVPVLEAGERDTSATYGTHESASASVCRELRIAGLVEYAFSRICDNRSVVKRLPIAKGVYAIEYRAMKPRLGSCVPEIVQSRVIAFKMPWARLE